MTRKQVAQRLGKSIATVRRIEGLLLHPRQDARGVRRFDPRAVEALAKDVAEGTVSLVPDLPSRWVSDHARDDANECERCVVLTASIEQLRTELDEQRREHRLAIERLQTECERKAAAYEAEAKELVAQVEELLATID
ncbi:MAG TPA: hypothetical protein VJV79_00020 [Polyangiaceae bacterium]|nr:hypothetical protein [Polyangiaceae bacterium]